MSKDKEPSKTATNPAAALAKLRWAKATDADKKAAAEAMTAGRLKIPKEKRSKTARKAAKARWAQEKKRAKDAKK